MGAKLSESGLFRGGLLTLTTPCDSLELVERLNRKNVSSCRRDNGTLVIRGNELGDFDCYAPPGFNPNFEVKVGDRLKVQFYRPNDIITRNPLPFFQAESIERA